MLNGKKITKLSKRPKLIAITGAESTGKSTLCKALASHYQIPFIPEYAREFVANLERDYTYDDLEHIARKQLEQLNTALKTHSEIIILDTWLVITKIWFEVCFSHYPLWMEETIKNTKIDLFLVCDTDLPWIEDPVRENGGNKRNQLQKRYIGEIKKYGFPYQIVNGEGEDRIQKALNFITNLK